MVLRSERPAPLMAFPIDSSLAAVASTAPASAVKPFACRAPALFSAIDPPCDAMVVAVRSPLVVRMLTSPAAPTAPRLRPLLLRMRSAPLAACSRDRVTPVVAGLRKVTATSAAPVPAPNPVDSTDAFAVTNRIGAVAPIPSPARRLTVEAVIVPVSPARQSTAPAALIDRPLVSVLAASTRSPFRPETAGAESAAEPATNASAVRSVTSTTKGAMLVPMALPFAPVVRRVSRPPPPVIDVAPSAPP